MYVCGFGKMFVRLCVPNPRHLIFCLRNVIQPFTQPEEGKNDCRRKLLRHQFPVTP